MTTIHSRNLTPWLYSFRRPLNTRIMEQPDFFPIPSPCIGVCEANEKGYCKGCLRSREERHFWQQMTDDQKHQVMRLLHMRKTKIRNKKLDLLRQQDEWEEIQQDNLFDDNFVPET